MVSNEGPKLGSHITPLGSTKISYFVRFHKWSPIIVVTRPILLPASCDAGKMLGLGFISFEKAFSQIRLFSEFNTS
jgi:hypothetical protein